MSNPFSIVVPCFEKKEILENFIKLIITKLDNIENCEIIFIDDGNHFEFENILNLKDNRVKLFKNNENKGYGYSIKKGVSAAKNEIIGIIDCDNSYIIDDLIYNLKNFSKKKINVLVGKRIFEYNEGYIRKTFRKFINFFSSVIFKYKIEDINSGIRIFLKGEFLKYINIYPDRFSISSTHTLSTVADKKKLEYFDTKYLKRSGKSKINIFYDPVKFIFLILKISLIFSPMKSFGLLGLFFILMSLIILIISFIFLTQIMDLTFLLLFISGLNFILLGVICEIVKINLK